MLLYALHGVVMILPVVVLYIAAGLAFPTWAGILVTYVNLISSKVLMIGKQVFEIKDGVGVEKHTTVETLR